MKKLFTFIVVLTMALAIQAQTANAVVFSEDGDRFTLLLNGEAKNETPLTNVKVNGLTGTFYSAKIQFENKAIGDLVHKNFAVELGQEATYIIKKNKKGEYVLRFHSYAPITATAANPSTESIDPEARRIAQVDDEHSTSGNSKTRTENPGAVGVTVTETTTTTKGAPANGEQINVGMNVGGLNMGININVSDSGVEQNTSTTTTTTTRTTSKSSNHVRNDEKVVVESGVTTCGMAMSKDAFSTAKKSVTSKNFDDARLTVAKQVAAGNCMTAAQIKEMAEIFGFDESRLEFAKYAYDYCVNRNEYYIVNDAFKFSSSIDELNEYLQSK
jgi:hypothetical protein